MLRIATEADASDIKRMAIDFYKASPYTKIKLNHEKVEEAVYSFFGNPTEKIIILSCNQTLPVGLIGGVAQEFPFNREKVAMEVMWWVDPECRGKESLKLIDAFEHWAKHIAGCSIIQMSLIGSLQLERISKIYTRRGYELAEQSYFKVL